MKKKNHTFATGKILFLSILYSFQDCFTSQPGTAIIVDKTNFATGHGLSMFYFVPYSKHIASKIQSSHRVDFILCLRTWMYGGIGQKACVVTIETVRNKMEEAKQKSYAHERANSYAINFLIPINLCQWNGCKKGNEKNIKKYK